MTATEVEIDDIKTEMACKIIEAVILSAKIGLPSEDIINKYVFELKECI